MSEIEQIESALNRTARRRRWFRAWNGLFGALFLASLVWLVATVAFKLLPLPFEMFSGLSMLFTLAVLFGFLWGARRRDNSLETAQWVDQQLGSKEKLSAAIEFHKKGGAWSQGLLREGLKCLELIQPRQLLHYRLPKIARWTVVLLFISATLGFVPEYRSEQYLQSKREKEVMKEVGQNLSSFAKRTMERRPPQMKPTEKAMVSMDELGQRLTSAKLTRAEALEKIASVADKLKDEAKQLGENPAFRRMQKEARQPSSAPTNTAEALQKQMAALRKQMEGASGDPEALEKMKRKLNQLQRAASGLNADEAGLSPEMQQQMSESMASLSQMAQDQGMSMPDLEEALKALKNGDVDQMMKALDSAQIDLDKMMGMAKALQKMEMAASEIGKDLSEQLERGQAQAAHDRLLEMAAKLQSGEQDREQMETLLKELADALDPAGDYGDVKDLLEQALQQGQANQKQDAAQSLKMAAAELKKLMEQFGDAQSLMASLEALRKAGMCIGNCTGWGQCDSGRPGVSLKPGGKPGKGVGTWADESRGWFYFDGATERWDNSQLTRPDVDPRGLTDRGEGEVPPGMVSSKVKGRFNPGGAMPSITLRGVSIKGESRVQFEEALSTAQDDAQSALSQQKVPRAYQQAVRDYFDDFAE